MARRAELEDIPVPQLDGLPGPRATEHTRALKHPAPEWPLFDDHMQCVPILDAVIAWGSVFFDFCSVYVKKA